jgi:hypothetical protein
MRIRLDDIEKAMRPNFVWIKHNSRRFQTNPLTEGNQSIGIIIFIVLAEAYGFSREDISDFLSIEDDEYQEKRELFVAEYGESKRFRGKVQLVLNALSYIEKEAISINHILNI